METKTYEQKKRVFEKLFKLTIECEEHLEYELDRMKNDGLEGYQQFKDQLSISK